MINVDELPVLERLVAHTAGVLLRIQQAAELLLSEHTWFGLAASTYRTVLSPHR
jgi:hypothetical protein